MRIARLSLLISVCTAMAVLLAIARAQSRSNSAPASAPRNPAAETAAQPYANLAQLMRGVLLPNANVVFFAQNNDPAAVKPAPMPSEAIDPLTGVYGGWGAVENSSLALAESTYLMMIPGRVCLNDRPVPVRDAEWIKFVQQLRTSGMKAFAAAQSKDQDKILDAAGDLSDACMNCHNKYRHDPHPGDYTNRCM